MPKLAPDQVPSYRLHRQSGQAIVTFSGRDVLLGAHGTRASREKYTRLIHEWEAAGRRLPVDQQAATVSMVVAAYWQHCQTYYGGDTGHGERRSIKLVLTMLRRLYGPTPAAEFGPLKFKAVREAMVETGWCRTYVNSQAGRMKRMFAWAVENEMVPASVHHALQAVAGLRSGKCYARESEAVKPVADGWVVAVRLLVAESTP